MALSKQERHVIQKFIDMGANPCSSVAEDLDNEMYKKGWQRCHSDYRVRLQFLLDNDGDKKALIKYAGKPKKKEKKS